MNREIKFRAWDRVNNKMLTPKKEGYQINTPQDDYFDADVYWMQFTGWGDKNGKEIYQGDLISENGSSPYEVIWQFHAGKWIMQSFEEGRYYREMAYDYAQRDYEVIGNIYENPELIKAS